MQVAVAAVQQQRKAIATNLEFIPPKCIAGSFPGWEFRFSIQASSSATIENVIAEALKLCPKEFDDFSVAGDEITVKILGTCWFPKPAGLDQFHAWLCGF